MRWFTALLVACSAAASPSDPRGWSEGQMAVGSARVLAGPPASELPELELPKPLVNKLDDKTVLFYFSPTCPHCQAVGDELGELERGIRKQAKVIGVASSGSSPSDILAFKEKYHLDFEVMIDSDRAIQTAMGVRSTPSMLLVTPEKGGHQRILDVWYPYQPGFDTYVKMRVGKDPWKAFDGSYLSSGSCAACHQQEAEAWSLTHHAVAWRTLTKRNEDQNPECVGCHVTGNGQAGGWTPGNDALTDVQCEACHGPSGPHDGKRDDPRQACEKCHDAKHSIQFSVEKGLPLIDHYAGNGMDDDAYRKRRMALVDGEAPRPLLAFGADATQGAAACKSCHEAETTHWQASGHAKAMATLDATQARDPACVKCHATASRGGPFPTELAEFRIDEGVGCEACHGPGEAHVKAGGGKDNIEGLGEDCPVCVIEAVCTTCHVPTWDKDWNLDTHLPKVGHTTKP